MKKVTVIIPMHNSSKHIKQCLESVINQTYNDIEIILVDDASKDNCVELVNDLIKKDNENTNQNKKTIKLIQLTQNVGAAIARNKGIEAASRRIYLFFRLRRLLGFR